MNSYSIKIFAATIGLFVLSICAIEYSIRHHFSADSYYTKAVISARASQVSCAVFGDSHGAAGFRDELDHCSNFAAGGMGFRQINDSVESVRRGNDLKQVVITFGPQLFSAERVNNKSAIFSSIGQEFTPLWNPLVMQPLMFDRWQLWFKDLLFKKPNKSLESNERHWGTVDKAKKNQAIDLRLLKQTPLPNFEASATQNSLLALIKTLRQTGAEVCMVRTPVTLEYAQALEAVVGSPMWQQLVSELSDAGAVVVDYRQVDMQLNESEFSNEDHLNPDGAMIFAKTAYKACFDKR